MYYRLLRSLAASAALTVVAMAQDGVLVGRMIGDLYVSPTGEFKVPSPVLPELGGTTTDTENVVTFHDRYNLHLSIACFKLDAAQRWERDTSNLRDYLLYFFRSFVLTDFDARFPKSSIESARFIPDLMGGSMVTFALLPGGSYFEDKNRVGDAPAQDPVIAKRGTLLFLRNQYIYIISTELAERATQRTTYNRTVEQENQLLSDRLTTLVGRLVFTDGKSRSAP